jgi:hypothetical protein
MTEWTMQQKHKRAYIEQLAKSYGLRANLGEDNFVLLEDGKVICSFARTESLDNDLANFREVVKRETKRKEAQFRQQLFRR